MRTLHTPLRALLLATAAFSAGCAGSIRLFEDGKVHHGRYNQVSREVEVNIDGERYAGTYVQGASAAFGLGFSGAQVSSFTGMSTDGSGQALLTSSSGKLLVCRFGSVVGYRGQGQCMTRDGRLFEMLIG